jgi:hypothetical protein
MKTEQQAAAMLSCCTEAMRKWRLLGRGPAYAKIGRLVRYREADLNAYLEANRIQPGEGGR